ncbi:hypothetical protein [Ruegeria sp.]|uniref:hypothetical protein n=1 Tax=Ruegeria sp. TaxID=1879320 RepID=UPI003B599AFA
MSTNLSEMASEIANALNGAIDGCDAFHMADLDADDVAEISVEMSDGRRCMISVVAHWEDD